MSKQYIGDAVYADVEGPMLKLTTEDGISISNTIYLEDFVWFTLKEYVEREWMKKKEIKKDIDETA